MTLTPGQVEDLFHQRVDHLILANGSRFTRSDLAVYIGAFRITTDDAGVPLDGQWRVIARYLRGPHGAPDLAELAEVRAAADAIDEAIARRDAAIRRAFPRWPREALAEEARLKPTRIYQIRATPPTKQENRP